MLCLGISIFIFKTALNDNNLNLNLNLNFQNKKIFFQNKKKIQIILFQKNIIIKTPYLKSSLLLCKIQRKLNKKLDIIELRSNQIKIKSNQIKSVYFPR